MVAIDLSRKKAVTAVGLGLGLATGSEWNDFIGDEPILSQDAQSIEEFCLLGGAPSV